MNRTEESLSAVDVADAIAKVGFRRIEDPV
jgi:hypothetical protein